MIKNSTYRKFFAILALNVLTAFMFVACDKELVEEPADIIGSEEPAGIIMTTKDSQVSFL